MEYYAAERKKELLAYTTAWMDQFFVLICVITQHQKDAIQRSAVLALLLNLQILFFGNVHISSYTLAGLYSIHMAWSQLCSP